MMKTAGWFVLATVCLVLAWMPAACRGTDPKSVADVTVKIAEDACHEVTDAGQSPQWVHLICEAIGIAGGVVDVLLPSQQWADVRARAAMLRDAAGPGK